MILDKLRRLRDKRLEQLEEERLEKFIQEDQAKLLANNQLEQGQSEMVGVCHKMQLKEANTENQAETVTQVPPAENDQVILNNHKDFPIQEYNEIDKSSTSSIEHAVHQDLKPKIQLQSAVRRNLSQSPKALDVEASRNVKLAQKNAVDDDVDPERESEFAETRREPILSKEGKPEPENSGQAVDKNDIENPPLADFKIKPVKLNEFGPQVDKRVSHVRSSVNSNTVNQSQEKLIAPDYPVFEFNEEENFDISDYEIGATTSQHQDVEIRGTSPKNYRRLKSMSKLKSFQESRKLKLQQMLKNNISGEYISSEESSRAQSKLASQYSIRKKTMKSPRSQILPPIAETQKETGEVNNDKLLAQNEADISQKTVPVPLELDAPMNLQTAVD